MESRFWTICDNYCSYFDDIFVSFRTFDIYNRNYFMGISENLRLAKEMYGPEWIVRVYYQIPKDSPYMDELCHLACKHQNLDICNAEQNPKFGNASVIYPLIWRFLPVLDPMVDVTLVRDLDSRITTREVIAVKQFLSSKKVRLKLEHRFF